MSEYSWNPNVHASEDFILDSTKSWAPETPAYLFVDYLFGGIRQQVVAQTFIAPIYSSFTVVRVGTRKGVGSHLDPIVHAPSRFVDGARTPLSLLGEILTEIKTSKRGHRQQTAYLKDSKVTAARIADGNRRSIVFVRSVKTLTATDRGLVNIAIELEDCDPTVTLQVLNT